MLQYVLDIYSIYIYVYGWIYKKQKNGKRHVYVHGLIYKALLSLLGSLETLTPFYQQNQLVPNFSLSQFSNEKN